MLTDEQADAEKVKRENYADRQNAYERLKHLVRDPSMLKPSGHASLEAALTYTIRETEKRIEARIIAHERKFPHQTPDTNEEGSK